MRVKDYLMNTKTCPRCNYTYTWINESKYFNKNKANKDGLASICKKCRSEEHAYYKSLKPNNLKDLKCKYVDCQNVFTPTHVLQEYCSKRCRDKANKFKDGKENFRHKLNFALRFKTKKEKETAVNNHKKWKNKDIEILLSLRFEGYSFQEIGKRLGRVTNACWKKYYSLTKENAIPRINFNKKEKDYNK